MSDPITKIERSRAKDIRQGVTAQRERVPSKKKKIVKPFRVMMPWPFARSEKPWCRARFVTREEAEKYIEKLNRELYRFRERNECWIEEA